ncbi:hypothetical protein EV383_2502 [Pseudonocardia sediminis]|uniref:Uncharacterized protein n=1 Tax=Pseudonocardia sediminis TaxID=1397368 RepID=A0A4Q7UV20_PSEST|nr:hypothetical protein EV383_2502 [Pseudonocardia sediminis]
MTTTVRFRLASLLVLIAAVAMHAVTVSPDPAGPSLTAFAASVAGPGTVGVASEPVGGGQRSVPSGTGQTSTQPAPVATGALSAGARPATTPGPQCPVSHHTPSHDEDVADSARPAGQHQSSSLPDGGGGLLSSESQPAGGAHVVTARAIEARAGSGAVPLRLLHCVSRS